MSRVSTDTAHVKLKECKIDKVDVLGQQKLFAAK